MAPDRKREAARQNAKRSTGPRTEAGKRRASRNSLKHGLAVAAPLNATPDVETLELAKAIIQDHDVPEHLRPLAIAVARAQVEVIRVREVRTALWARLSDEQPGASGGQGSGTSRIRDHLTQLERLERYERRSTSARKTAIRELMKAVRLGS